MIRGDAKPPVADLHGDVAVAEVVGRARERLRRIAFDVQHLLHGRDDLDHPTVGRHDPIAPAQHLPARKRDGDFFTRNQCRALPAFLPPVYRCAIGSTSAGAQVSNSPSAVTS